MIRRLAPVALAVAGALTLAACGGASDKAEPELDPTKLTIYSAQHKNLVDAWVKGFEADTGVKVQVRQGKDASMGNQLVAEGDKTPADVFLTENSPAITVVQDAGLLATVDQSTLDQVQEAYRPSSGEWVGIAARSTVLIYNPSKISEAELPASMLDLADPKWKDKWGGAPAGADFQAIVSGMLEAKGEDETKTWLKGLKDNAKVYQNNIATMKAVNAGEVPMGIMYHYYWYRDQALTKEGSANTKLHYFKGEDVGAFVSVSAGGVLKASTKQADAQKFLAWVTSAKGQEALVSSKSMEYAVGEGVASDPALPPLDSLQAPSIDPFTLDGPEVIKLMTAAGIL
jgi:iron(III) transport system substrate-binding protein